jgi:hypothetical protein
LGGLVGIHKKKRREDFEGQRRQQAPKRLRKHLSQLDESEQDTYGQIWKVLSEYISARLNLLPGEGPSQELGARLPDTVSPETKVELETWISGCERARFAGESGDQNRETLLGDFRGFMLKLDREWGR